jgi:hypothetical protein
MAQQFSIVTSHAERCLLCHSIAMAISSRSMILVSALMSQYTLTQPLAQKHMFINFLYTQQVNILISTMVLLPSPSII